MVPSDSHLRLEARFDEEARAVWYDLCEEQGRSYRDCRFLSATRAKKSRVKSRVNFRFESQSGNLNFRGTELHWYGNALGTYSRRSSISGSNNWRRSFA